MLTYQINSRKNETHYLFIDGGYLDNILNKIGLKSKEIGKGMEAIGNLTMKKNY
jgi:uncharacterized protein Smg (DUF494 family)